MSYCIGTIECPECGTDLTELAEDDAYDIIEASEYELYCPDCEKTSTYSVHMEITLTEKG